MSSIALAKRKLSRETSGVEDRAALKKWLRGLRDNRPVADKLSQEDVADLVGVTDKTIKSLESPAKGFGNGLTLLRYLKVLGALPDAPVSPPALSRLAALEELVAAQGEEMTNGLHALAEEVRALRRERDDEDPPAKQAQADV